MFDVKKSNGWKRERRVVAIGGRGTEQIRSAVKAGIYGRLVDTDELSLQLTELSAGALANVATT